MRADGKVLASGDLSERTVNGAPPPELQPLTGWELVEPTPREPALTVEQEQAIARRSEPLLLAAGAGSGKTSVLVERFVRAVRDDGIAPERILAITFTERAAGELRERVRARLLALGEPAAAQAVGEHAYVGTFHGFCARVLRAHAREAGLAAEHQILDEGVAARLRRRAFARALGEFVSGERAEAVDLIAAYTADRARATVLGVYAELRSRGQPQPRLPAPSPDRAPLTLRELDAARVVELRALNERGARTVALWDELLRLFGDRYGEAKRERDGVDFDDLELCAGELLAREPALRAAWAGRFELLMVDELQDVNPRQLALLGALERENLFTVGDEWQSIYGFRHADVSLFRDRHAELAPRGQSLRMTCNFRARPALVQAVNAVFARRFGESYTPLHAGRARARARHGGRTPVELLLSDRRGRRDWRVAEARLLAARLAELLEDGTGPGQIAVLLRGTRDIDCYERALRERGVETAADAGVYWQRQEVADLLAHLRAVADPTDELALYGVLAAPPVSLSSDRLVLLALAAQAGERDDGLWQVAREQAGERASAHCAWLAGERELLDELELSELVARAIEHGGCAERLRDRPEGERTLANMRRLVELAADWERAEGRDLAGFLEEAAYQQAAGGLGFLAGADANAEPDAPVGQDEAVRLMSVHAAKGLEFDVVCVADLGRAPSMATPDLLVGDRRVGVRLLEPADPEPRASLDYAELSQQRREAQAEEEDRIVYVAMTRARERLVLSGALDFASWPRERPGAPPVAWLAPALAPELPALCARAQGQVETVLSVEGTDVPLRCVLDAAGAVGAWP